MSKFFEKTEKWKNSVSIKYLLIIPVSFIVWLIFSFYPTYDFYENKFFPEMPTEGILKSCKGSNKIKLAMAELDINNNNKSHIILNADGKNTISAKIVDGELRLDASIYNRFGDKIFKIENNVWNVVSPEKIEVVESRKKELYVKDKTFDENFIKIVVEKDCSISICGGFF